MNTDTSVIYIHPRDFSDVRRNLIGHLARSRYSIWPPTSCDCHSSRCTQCASQVRISTFYYLDCLEGVYFVSMTQCLKKNAYLKHRMSFEVSFEGEEKVTPYSQSSILTWAGEIAYVLPVTRRIPRKWLCFSLCFCNYINKPCQL